MLDSQDSLDRLKNRDPEMIAALVREHSRPLYRAARGFGFGPEEAEDIVQDVFTVFLSSLDRFEGRSTIRTWLFGILHRKKLEKFREKQRDIRHDPIDSEFESRFNEDGSWRSPPLDLQRLVESRELGQSIAGCMEQLPSLQRSVFVLREMEELETNEVCKILEVTVTHMGVLMHRARTRLRHCLENAGWGTRN